MHLRDLGIRTRVFILVLVPILGLVAVLLSSWSVMARVRIGGPVATELMAQKDLIADILPPPLFIVEAHLLAHEIITATTPAQIESAVKGLEKCKEQFKERREFWRNGLTDELADAMYERVIPAAEQYLTLATTDLVAHARAARREQAQALVRGRLEELFSEHRAAVVSAAEQATRLVEQTATRAEAEVAAGLRTMLVSAGIAVVLMVGLATWVGLSISVPLRRVLEAMREVARGNGDLRKRIDVKPDASEIGQFVTLFNSFTRTINSIVREIDATGRELNERAGQISAAAARSVEELEKQESNIQRIGATVDELTGSTASIIGSSQRATESAQATGSVAGEGESTMKLTIQGMERINEAVDAGSQSVQTLGSRSDEIGQIIGVINDIADQTNLLALNAAIEAARAGEHGRGFAVVADEVRKLAERTTQATKRVAESIHLIQSETTTAVDRMRDGSAQVHAGVELARNASDGLRRIVEQIHATTGVIADISNAAAGQGALSNQILRDLEQVTATSTSVTAAGNATRQAVAELSERTKRLIETASRFSYERRDEAAPRIACEPHWSSELGGVTDVSATGCRVRIAPDAEVVNGSRVRLTIGSGQRSFEARARVAWVRVIDGQRFCGVHFDEPLPAIAAEAERSPSHAHG